MTGRPPATPADESLCYGTVLADPVRASLTGRHAAFGRRHGRALVYADGVATFASLPADADAADWSDLAELLGPGQLADLFSNPAAPPPGWDPVFTLPGLQLVADGPSFPAAQHGGPGVVVLGVDDTTDMLALAARTRPGPFFPRTRELGRYLGIRDAGGDLVAMAGERLAPAGWTEISAVCTDPTVRGRGYATTLVTALRQDIERRGERAFLHVAADHATARKLYEDLGFRLRREVTFRGYQTPTR